MRKIKLFDPYIGEEEKEEIQKVLKSKYWASGSGNGRVKELQAMKVIADKYNNPLVQKAFQQYL